MDKRDERELERETEESVMNGGISSEEAERDRIAHDEDLRYDNEEETLENSDSRFYENGKDYLDDDMINEHGEHEDRDRAHEGLEEDILNRR